MGLRCCAATPARAGSVRNCVTRRTGSTRRSFRLRLKATPRQARPGTDVRGDVRLRLRLRRGRLRSRTDLRAELGGPPGTRTRDHRIKSQTGGLSATTTAKRVQQTPTGNPLSFNTLIESCLIGDNWLELRPVEPECPTSVPRADARTGEAVSTRGEFWRTRLPPPSDNASLAKRDPAFVEFKCTRSAPWRRRYSSSYSSSSAWKRGTVFAPY
jgi:hypothetical protein